MVDTFGEEVIDVAVIPGTGLWHRQFVDAPPVREAVQIWGDLTLGPISDPDRFFAACGARGENFDPHRQFGALYAFQRRDAPGGSFQWDPDGLIQQTIALSRFVRPNSHCTEYAARLIDREAKPIIAPVPLEARYYAYAYQRESERGWLDLADAEALAHLVTCFFANRPFPERLRTAMWTAEYFVRVAFQHIHHMLVVTALEALIKTSQHRSTRQFASRVAALAEDLSVPGVNEELAVRAYKARSDAAHGEQQTVGDPNELSLVEDVLRAAVRRAVEDPDFCALFSSAESVEARWPLDD